MNGTTWKMTILVLVLSLALLRGSEAQQHPQHHRGSTQAEQEQPSQDTPDTPGQMPMMQQMHSMMQQMHSMMQQMHSMMQQMHGRMGRHRMMAGENGEAPDRGMMRGHGRMRGRGMMRGHGRLMGHMQRQLEQLTQQLDLSDEQQSKVQTLLRTHAKDGIRLQADIDTASIDLQQLLDTQPVDMAKVKTMLQIIAGKEADLRLTHIAAMQDIRELLTPDQQQQFRAVWGHMLGGGGKMAHGHMMGRGGMKGQGPMRNPCGMQGGQSDQ